MQLLLLIFILFVGCSRAPLTGQLDNGGCEQVFLPWMIVQDDGVLNCQWVEFYRDSIGGAGANWNSAAQKFDSARGYGFIERQYVVCVPELVRWTTADRSTATFIAHSCIQECFMVWQDSVGKREAAWLAAPAIQTRPLKVDSIYVVVHESSTVDGLMVIWIDRHGRELSRDTLAVPGPDFVAATGGGISLVRADEDSFAIYHIGRACSWVDSGKIARTYSGKASIGTDYFVQDGELFIVNGYSPERDRVEMEMLGIEGTTLRLRHTAPVTACDDLQWMACRAAVCGEQFPKLVAVAQSAERTEVVVLEQDGDGAWSRSASLPVENTIQEFCAAVLGGNLLVAYTAASEQSAAANTCRWIQFAL